MWVILDKQKYEEKFIFNVSCVHHQYIPSIIGINIIFIPNFIKDMNQNIIHTEEHGGNGGGEFSDPVLGNNLSLRKLLIHCGGSLDSIQLMLGNGQQQKWLQKHGGNGGVQHIWEIPFGQHIKFVEVYSGSLVDALIFITNTGLRSPRFGGNGGSKHIITIADGYGIIGVRGKSGSLIDRIGFITERLPNQFQQQQQTNLFQQAFNQGFNPNQGFIPNQGQGFNPNQGQGFNNQGYQQGYNPNQQQGYNQQGYEDHHHSHHHKKHHHH